MFIIGKTTTRQRGDTLVEVLVAIAVVSLILGGAYVVTNKSLQATRAAQERGNALKIAEAQIEQLKSVIATNPDSVFGGAAPATFCISSTSTVVSDTNTDCAVGTTGAPTTTEPKFHLSIQRTNNDFVLKETWANVSGQGNDSLQMSYRVYQ